MNSDGWAALTGIGTYSAFRLIDKFLPSGHHFRFVERWMVKDKSRDNKEVTDED